MQYFLPNKAYQILKWAGLIACPALATFIGATGGAWSLQNVDAIVLTLNALGVLIGALIGASAAASKPEHEPEPDVEDGEHFANLQ